MRTNVTNLEAFRLFRDEDWMSYDDLMLQLTTGKEESLQMAASIVFHDLLRGIGKGEYAWLERGRFAFDLTRLDCDVAFSPLRELRCQKTYDVDGEQLDVRGRVDGADGVAVEDHKIRFGQFDAEKYADSMQWRLYMDMIGGQMFRYNVFEAPDFTDATKARWERCRCPEFKPISLDDLSGYDGDAAGAAGTDDAGDICTCGAPLAMHMDGFEITVKALHVLPLYTYPAMQDDVIAHLRDYVSFARDHLTPEAILAWQQEQNLLHAHLNPGK